MNHSELIRRPVSALAEAANDAMLTMSSREIAELVGSRHDSVKRTVERLAERGTIPLPPLVEVENDGPGPARLAEYRIGKRDSYVIVAQLSPEFTARLVDRWQELEAAAAPRPPAELSRLEILQIAMEAEQGRLAAEAKIAIMAPQVEALHRIALTPTDASMCITDAAKHLKVKPRSILPWLQSIQWVYKRAEDGRVVAYQDRMDRGYLEHKIVEYPGRDGTTRQAPQVRVTQKGLVKLAHRLEAGKGPMP